VCPKVSDALEVVEVEEEHAEGRLRSIRLGHRVVEPLAEEEPVAETGQAVEVGEPADLLLDAAAVGDVLGGAFEAGRPAVGVAAQLGLRLEDSLGAVREHDAVIDVHRRPLALALGRGRLQPGEVVGVDAREEVLDARRLGGPGQADDGAKLVRDFELGGREVVVPAPHAREALRVGEALPAPAQVGGAPAPAQQGGPVGSTSRGSAREVRGTAVARRIESGRRARQTIGRRRPPAPCGVIRTANPSLPMRVRAR
jgi:hypothetical protein